MFLLISGSLDHDKNETEIAFDTRLIAVTHEASMDGIGQRALPKIMVVIMDGCGRIRVSFREFQVIRKLMVISLRLKLGDHLVTVMFMET